MARLKIYGKTKLCGRVKISGAKNEALKAIPLTVILKNKVRICNAPNIIDVVNQAKILESLGAKISFADNVISVDPTLITRHDITSTCAGKLRASIVFAGPLLARFGEVSLPYPGGCLIGARPIDTHLNAFRQVGAKIKENKDVFSICLANPTNSNVILQEKSVTATENIVLYAAGVPVKTKIENCAIEPEITDLLHQLVKAGCRIKGIGERSVEIIGSKDLSIDEFTVMPDRIEAGTFAAAFISTGGQGEISPFPAESLTSFLDILEDCGAKIKIKDDTAIVSGGGKLKPFKISTAPYPDFPTDLQSPMSLIAACAEGESIIIENMFENRLFYLNELKKMGLKAEILDPHTAKINGGANLKPTTIESLDLRSGITLLIAAIMTEGTTIIENAQIIDRGYEKIEEKLKALGAKIERID